MTSYEDALKEWYRRVRRWEISHSRAAADAQKWRKRLGIASAFASFVVASGIFATLEATPGTYPKAIAGILSLISGVLATVLTFLKDSDSFQQHKTAEIAFGRLRIELEQRLPTAFQSDKEWTDFSVPFKQRLEAAENKAPVCAQKFVDAADARMERRPGLLA